MSGDPREDRDAAPRYVPYEPQDDVSPVADGVWTVEGPVLEYGIRPFNVPCPTRMTVMSLKDGGLALHSPTAFSDRLLDRLSELGPIRALIGPNSFHHLHLAAWAGACPDAEIYTPRKLGRTGLPRERTQVLSEPCGELFEGALDYVEVDGSWIELVFLHRPSRTAVFTDLIQNFELDRVKGGLPRTVLRLAGASGNPPRASIEMRMAALLRGRKKSVAESVRIIRAWQPDRLLMAHGAQPEGDVDTLLEDAFRWTL
jgi:hypothetical protein